MADIDNDNLNKESLLKDEEGLNAAIGVSQVFFNDFSEKTEKSAEAEDMEKFEEMFKAGVHFGYSRSKRCPKMADYVYGIKNNVEIFDLEKTRKCTELAADFLKTIFQSGKMVLFVGTKPGVDEIIKKAAEQIKMPYVSIRWLGGTLTNFKVIRNRVLNFEKIKKDIESDSLHKYTKKERVRINKEFEKMKKKFNGLELLTSLPAALVVVDPKEESTAVREARRMNIPVVAVMNSDCDPVKIDYPIPANDAAPKSVEYLIKKIVEECKKETANNLEN